MKLKLIAPIVVATVIVTICYIGATAVGNAPVIIIGGSAIVAYIVWLLTTYQQPTDASKVLPFYLMAVGAQPLSSGAKQSREHKQCGEAE
jgi:hypothetical protein